MTVLPPPPESLEAGGFAHVAGRILGRRSTLAAELLRRSSVPVAPGFTGGGIPPRLLPAPESIRRSLGAESTLVPMTT